MGLHLHRRNVDDVKVCVDHVAHVDERREHTNTKADAELTVRTSCQRFHGCSSNTPRRPRRWSPRSIKGLELVVQRDVANRRGDDRRREVSTNAASEQPGASVGVVDERTTVATAIATSGQERQRRRFKSPG